LLPDYGFTPDVEFPIINREKGNCEFDIAVLYLSSLIQNLSHSISAIGMLVVQNSVNFFIPSGSCQAVVMMFVLQSILIVVGVAIGI